MTRDNEAFYVNTADRILFGVHTNATASAIVLGVGIASQIDLQTILTPAEATALAHALLAALPSPPATTLYPTPPTALGKV